MPFDSILGAFAHSSHEALSANAITGTEIGKEAFTGVQAGGTEVLDSTSNGVTLVKDKTSSMNKASLLRKSQARHKYAQKVVRFMLRNSLRNKMRIMVPGFGLSLLVPPSVMEATRPAFFLLALHLGERATEDTHSLWQKRRSKKIATHHMGEAPDPDIVLDEKIAVPKLTIRDVIKKAHKADTKTTLEITAAVLGSIDTLPIAEQVPIMVVYGTGMTLGVYGITYAMVKMESMGQRIENWEPKNKAQRLLHRTNAHNYIGTGLQNLSPRLFRVLPWAGAAAKFVTSGRLIAHASDTMGQVAEHTSHAISQVPVIGNHLTGLAGSMAVWGLTGLAVGGGVNIAKRTVVKPAVGYVKDTALYAAYTDKLYPELKTLTHTGVVYGLNAQHVMLEAMLGGNSYASASVTMALRHTKRLVAPVLHTPRVVQATTHAREAVLALPYLGADTIGAGSVLAAWGTAKAIHFMRGGLKAMSPRAPHRRRGLLKPRV